MNHSLAKGGLTVYPKSQLLTTIRKESFENLLGKGENAGNQHFLLFPKGFPPFPRQISIYKSHLFCHLQRPLNFVKSWILSFGKGLMHLHGNKQVIT